MVSSRTSGPLARRQGDWRANSASYFLSGAAGAAGAFVSAGALVSVAFVAGAAEVPPAFAGVAGFEPQPSVNKPRLSVSATAINFFIVLPFL